MTLRQSLFIGVIAVVVICATILGALDVVSGDRVIDMLSVVVASFLGALSANGLTRSSAGMTIRPSPGEASADMTIRPSPGEAVAIIRPPQHKQ